MFPMSTLLSLFCNFRWKAHLQGPRKFICSGLPAYPVNIENIAISVEQKLISAGKVKFIIRRNASCLLCARKIDKR